MVLIRGLFRGLNRLSGYLFVPLGTPRRKFLGGSLVFYYYAGMRPLPVTTASQDILRHGQASSFAHLSMCLKPASRAGLRAGAGRGS
jgi:hypothetical protein